MVQRCLKLGEAEEKEPNVRFLSPETSRDEESEWRRLSTCVALAAEGVAGHNE